MNTDDSLPVAGASGEPSSSTAGVVEVFSAPAPHATVDLPGVLVSASLEARSRPELTAIILPALTSLVRSATHWDDDLRPLDEYIGDFRFLVVDFIDGNGVTNFAQIWSEPQSSVIIEIGPGRREPSEPQAVADRIAPVVRDRGFVISGSAANFRRRLAVPSADESEGLACELMSIVLDVLGYDGRAELSYRLHQGTVLKEGHVVFGMERGRLFDLLQIWGLRPRIPKGVPTGLQVRSQGLNFWVYLMVQRQREDSYWEIHCSISFPHPAREAAEIIQQVNSAPNLFKAFSSSGDRDGTCDVRYVIGINLAGGVTLDHIRCQIFEWLEGVRRVIQRPSQPAEADQAPVPSRVVH